MNNLDIIISADSTSKEIEPVAMAIHEVIVGLPLTMRTRNKRGVRIEMGKVLDYDYTGPVLEMALDSNSTIRTIPKTGDYSGTPVMVTTIKDKDGNALAAIGVVDVIHSL
jgi:hypothetical protein